MSKKVLVTACLCASLLTSSLTLATHHHKTANKAANNVVGGVAEVMNIPVVRFGPITMNQAVYVSNDEKHVEMVLNKIGVNEVKLGDEVGKANAKQYLKQLWTETKGSPASMVAYPGALAIVSDGDGEYELLRPDVAIADYVKLEAIKVKPALVMKDNGFKVKLAKLMGVAPGYVTLKVEDMDDLKEMNKPAWYAVTIRKAS